MKDSNKPEFISTLSAVLDLYGRKLSAGAYSIWFGALARFPLDSAKLALQSYVQTGEKSAPVPADILKILEAQDGWLGVEEAWSIVSPALADESVTVFWTPPMQRAFGVALQIEDDRVASRMAFKEVYTRELSEARKRGDKPQWQMSPGTNLESRVAAVLEAERLGRISSHAAMKLLPNLDNRVIPGLNLKLLEKP